MLSVGAIALLPAAAGHPTVHAALLPIFPALGYLVTLVVLVVFGVWGFRLGDYRRDEGNGGGSARTNAGSPPPAGGRELTADFAAWEEQLEIPEPEPAAPRRD
jgi:hypothetical protein